MTTTAVTNASSSSRDSLAERAAPRPAQIARPHTTALAGHPAGRRERGPDDEGGDEERERIRGLARRPASGGRPGRTQEQHREAQRFQRLSERPAHGRAGLPGDDQGDDDDDADGVALPPRPPVPQQLGPGQSVNEVKRNQGDRGRDDGTEPRDRDELDHVLAATERPGCADYAADQRRAGQRLERVAGRDDRSRRQGRLDGEIDERRADPDARPESEPEDEDRRERDSGRRPHRGRVAGRDGEKQGELGDGEVDDCEEHAPQPV